MYLIMSTNDQGEPGRIAASIAAAQIHGLADSGPETAMAWSNTYISSSEFLERYPSILLLESITHHWHCNAGGNPSFSDMLKQGRGAGATDSCAAEGHGQVA
jgi:hypothetical protein